MFRRAFRRLVCSSAATGAADGRSSPVFQLGRLNHVAVAVPKLDAARKLYAEAFGTAVTPPERLPEHGVTVSFVKLPNTNIELLEVLGENSPIANFMAKNANGGIHHICIEVDDINKAMERVKAFKIRPLSETPKIGAHGKPVVFLHPKDCNGILVELEQA